MVESESHACSICLEAYAEKELKTIQFGCTHRFHSACFFGWLDATGRNENTSRCPLCRQEVIRWYSLRRAFHREDGQTVSHLIREIAVWLQPEHVHPEIACLFSILTVCMMLSLYIYTRLLMNMTFFPNHTYNTSLYDERIYPLGCINTNHSFILVDIKTLLLTQPSPLYFIISMTFEHLWRVVEMLFAYLLHSLYLHLFVMADIHSVVTNIPRTQVRLLSSIMEELTYCGITNNRCSIHLLSFTDPDLISHAFPPVMSILVMLVFHKFMLFLVR